MYNEYCFETGLGKMKIVENGIGITEIDLVPQEYQSPENHRIDKTPLLTEAESQIVEYFAGKRKAFDLPLDPIGTDFQKKVWQALCRIPFGETRSYRQIAEEVCCPKGFRAVGMANNRNPIMIVIPCHRVIGTNGSLVGYAGGLAVKEKLLRLEGAL